MSVATANGQSQSNELAVRMRKPPENETDVRSLLWDNKRKLEGLLPEHISVDRFLAQAFRAIVEAPPGIWKCTRSSILNSVLKACKYGLELDGIIGEAYLVPYKTECELIPGYKGLMKLAHQANEIKSIIAACVYKADKFRYELGMHVDVRHLPKAENDEQLADENITHVYAVAALSNGGYVPCVWPVSKIRHHRDTYSPAYKWAESGDRGRGGGQKDSIWHKQFPKMAMKTVIRDLMGSGAIPLSVDIRQMIEVEKKLEGENFGDSESQKDLDALSAELAGRRGIEQRQESPTFDASTSQEEPEPEQASARQRSTSQPRQQSQRKQEPQTEEQPPKEQATEAVYNEVVQDFEDQIKSITCEEDAQVIRMTIKRSSAVDAESKKYLERLLNGKVNSLASQA